MLLNNILRTKFCLTTALPSVANVRLCEPMFLGWGKSQIELLCRVCVYSGWKSFAKATVTHTNLTKKANLGLPGEENTLHWQIVLVAVCNAYVQSSYKGENIITDLLRCVLLKVVTILICSRFIVVFCSSQNKKKYLTETSNSTMASALMENPDFSMNFHNNLGTTTNRPTVNTPSHHVVS